MEHVGAALVISANYPKKRAGTAAGRGKGEILPSLLHMMVSCSSLDKNVFVVLGRALWTRQSKLGGIIPNREGRASSGAACREIRRCGQNPISMRAPGGSAEFWQAVIITIKSKNYRWNFHPCPEFNSVPRALRPGLWAAGKPRFPPLLPACARCARRIASGARSPPAPVPPAPTRRR